MKKVFLFLLVSAFSLCASAQIQRTVSFDFMTEATWQSLISNYPGKPSSTSDFASISSFHRGLLTFTFSKGAIRYNADGDIFCLSILQGGEMTISVSGDATLDKIEFLNALVADLSLPTSEPGTYDAYNKVWTSSGSVSSVKFKNFTNSSYIWKMNVIYTEPSVVLSASVSPSASDTPLSFSQMILNYQNANGSMMVQNASGINITGNYEDATKGSINKPLSAIASGKTVTLSLSEPIVHDGTFTITVPSRAFKDAEGYENIGFTTTVTVRENRATFVTNSVIPANNSEITALSSPIILNYATNVGYVDSEKHFRLFREGVTEPLAQLKAVPGDDAKQVKLLFEHSASDSFTESGIYHVTIDEKTIYNHNYGDDVYERYNPSFTLTYTIPEVLDPLKELKDEANALVGLIGKVGYPVVGSNADILLKSVTGTGSSPTQEQLEIAINTFYNTTDVVLPSTDKWYTIASVSNKETNNMLYLEYADGALTLGNTASAFKVNSVTGKVIVLETQDGKFLHVMMNTDEYDYTSSTNVTDEKKYVNNLTLSKLLIAGAEKSVAGMFTISGGMGNDKTTGNPVGTATALVDHSVKKFITSITDNQLYFENVKTSAFIFAETNKPFVDESVNPKAQLVNSVVTTNEQPLTLIVSGAVIDSDITTVTLKNADAPYFVLRNSDGSEGVRVNSFTGNQIVEKQNGNEQGNNFIVHLNGLSFGKYYLELPKGTFDYASNSKSVEDLDMKVAFEISYTEQVPYNFQKDYTYYKYPAIPTDQPVKAVDMNNFGIYIYVGVNYNDLCIDSSKKVKLGNWNDITQNFRYGHLTQDNEFMNSHPGTKAYRIVWEPAIKAEDFPRYTECHISFDEASFGDENFGKWLNNHSSVDEEACHVNGYAPRFVIIDNNATDITCNHADRNIEQHIYDLNGRRVTTPAKGGVYIINGKKVLIK